MNKIDYIKMNKSISVEFITCLLLDCSPCDYCSFYIFCKDEPLVDRNCRKGIKMYLEGEL